MDGTRYLPTVAWSFKVRNVILLSSATIETPATFRCTAIPFDSSDPGANEEAKEIGFYVTDNIGNIYTVIGLGLHTVDLSDDFRCGVGPQTGKWAVLSKSVGNGTAPFLGPIHYRRLDKAAIDNVRRIELDVLWKHRLFTYVAFASDDVGTDFTIDPTSKLPYSAMLISEIELDPETLTAGDFVGLWRSGGSGSFPATIDSTTTNVDNGTTHTHELGKIAIENVISGSPVVYGALYNWWAVTDSRNIAPVGFHVPSKAEWEDLFNSLDTYDSGINGWTILGTKLRETGSSHWYDYYDEEYQIEGTDNYGFTLRGGGVRNATFYALKQAIQIWSSTSQLGGPYAVYTAFSLNEITDSNGELTSGYSLRYIADSGTPTTAIGNDGKIYPCVTIGTQCWTAANSNETKYRDGSYIHGFEGGIYTPISNEDWAALTTEAMCYYDDNEAYGGGQTPLSNQHNSLAGLNTGDYQHLTAAELAKLEALTIPLQITGITLLSASWSLVSDLHEYDLANANITANHVVDVIPENADIAIVKAAEILPKTVSSAGSVKLYATNAPTGNIGVTIILTTATT